MSRTSASSLLASLVFLASACGDDAMPVGPARPDAGVMVDAGPPPPATQWSVPPTRPAAGTPSDIAAGDVSGAWCGAVSVLGDVVVPVGQTLTVCAGATVSFTAGSSLTVRGTLQVDGTSAAPVFFYAAAADRWPGIGAQGTVVATYFDVSGAAVALETLAGADVTVTRGWLHDNDYGLRIGGGGTFDHVAVSGGSTVSMSGGQLSMTDSIIDLIHPTLSPDCTNFSGGGATLTHVRFTGCHCPLHFTHTDGDVTIADSLFDGAAVAMMIAETRATAHGNAFIATGSAIQDIGGGIVADVSGNYWEAPTALSTTMAAQFTGADMQLDAAPADVGPRP